MLLLSGIAGLPTEVLTDRVDVLELEHFYDAARGGKVFDQWIGWRWNGERHEVVFWRFTARNRIVLRIRGKQALFMVGEKDDCLRVVWFNGFRETWDVVDHEVEDREKLPSVERRGLTAARKP